MRALNSILNFWKRLRNGEISTEINGLRCFRGKNEADLIEKCPKTNLENQISKRKNKKQINTGAQRKKKKKLPWRKILNKYFRPSSKKKTFVGKGISFSCKTPGILKSGTSHYATKV